MGIGFWKGKIDIKLDKYQFSPGENIVGDIHLKLKKETRARALTIRLIGEEKTTQIRRDDEGTHSQTDKVKIFDLKVPVSGEGEYSKGEYKFTVPIPKNLFQRGARPKGVVGDVVNVLEGLSGRRTSIEWKLVANLDIPKGFDLSGKQKILID